jgi:pyrimidine-nucleoside phosphorylase
MDYPLGRTVGNFLEVREAVSCLQGQGPRDVMEVTLRLTAHMLVLGNICKNKEEAEELAKKSLAGGAALAKFLQNIALQGGEPDSVLHPAAADSLAKQIPISAWETGYLAACDAYQVGLAAVCLGAGRARKEDGVLPHVGIEFCKVVGDKVSEGEVLFYLYTDGDRGKDEALRLLRNACRFSPGPVIKPSLILKEMVDL